MHNFDKFKGLFPAMVTPFTKDGKLHKAGVKEVVNFLVEKQKVDGIYISGSTGEFLLLSFEDKKEVMKLVAEANAGRVTLVAQIGSLNIEETKELAKLAKELKYDAISAITPYYYNFSFNETHHYYEEISKAADIPMLIYYLPQLAGQKVSTDQFGKLLEIKNVIGSKYGATDLFTFERLMSKYPDKVFMFAWDEALAMGLTMGAKGFIGSTYNVNAKGANAIIKAWEVNDKEAVMKLTHTYNDYVLDLISKGLMQSLKAIMRLHGVDAGYTRKPFWRYEDEEIKKHAEFITDKYLK